MDHAEPFIRQHFVKDEDDLAETYHHNTKYARYLRSVDPDAYAATEAYPPVKSLQYAPDGEGCIKLPDPTLADAQVALAAVMRARRSQRDFTGEPVSLEVLAHVLFHTYGITGMLGGDTPQPARVVPSAGARHPLEVYIVANHVDGLARGVWHYHPETHTLEPTVTHDVSDKMSDAFMHQPFLPDAAFIILIAGVFSRTMVKYKDRGYRLVLFEAGHAVQNANLLAVGLGLGSVNLGGFLDDELNAMLKLNGEDENVLYACAIGQLRT